MRCVARCLSASGLGCRSFRRPFLSAISKVPSLTRPQDDTKGDYKRMLVALIGE